MGRKGGGWVGRAEDEQPVEPVGRHHHEGERVCGLGEAAEKYDVIIEAERHGKYGYAKLTLLDKRKKKMGKTAKKTPLKK